MNITDILEQLNENLSYQDKLKRDLSIEADKQGDLEANLRELNQTLANNKEEFEELYAKVGEWLTLKLFNLKNNLAVYMVKPEKFSLSFKFLNRDYNLMNDRFYFDRGDATIKGAEGIVPESFAEALQDMYLENGDVVFAGKNITTLQKIKELYDNNQTSAINKLISVEVEKRTSKLEKQKSVAEDEASRKTEEFNAIDARIEELSNSTAAKLIGKLFKKKLRKLKEDKLALEKEIGRLDMEIKHCDAKLEDKNGIKNEATNYVIEEINALMDVLHMLSYLKEKKFELEDFKEINITKKEKKIAQTRRELASSKLSEKEIKSILQLNKKINSDIIENALYDEEFVEQFLKLEDKDITVDNRAAIKLIKSKFNMFVKNNIGVIVE